MKNSNCDAAIDQEHKFDAWIDAVRQACPAWLRDIEIRGHVRETEAFEAFMFGVEPTAYVTELERDALDLR